MAEPVLWTPEGQARSARFNDVYRSRFGALAQAQAVYLAGCGLPQGWRGHGQFTVLETGFGLGLNFLACWAAWAADPQRSASLHFVSVEAYPVAAADIVRSAHALLLEGGDAAMLARVQALALQLAAQWQVWPEGLHELRFDQGRVVLALAVWPVQQALRQLPAVGAQALFLDGFTPALNPDMWRAQTLALLPRHCRPGCRLASYTVAGTVRQGLARQGFSVRKCPGLPPKRHRLEGVFALASPPPA